MFYINIMTLTVEYDRNFAMIDKDTQSLKFPWAAFVPVNDDLAEDVKASEGGLPKKNVQIQYVAARKGIYIKVGGERVELDVYEADAHGPLPSTEKKGKVKRFQLLCPECLQAPLTHVGKSRHSGTVDVGEYFRTVSNDHQVPHSPICAMRVLDLSNRFNEVSDEARTPIDPTKSPVVFVNIKKKLLGDLEVVHKGYAHRQFHRAAQAIPLNDEAEDAKRIVVYRKSGEKQLTFDQSLSGRERYSGKKIDDLVLASSLIPSDLLEKTSFIYEGRATPWSLFHIGALSGHKTVQRGGKVDPFAKMIKYMRQGVRYPVLFHVEIKKNSGRRMDTERTRFSLPAVFIDVLDEDAKFVKKQTLIPLLHVRDEEVVTALQEGGAFTAIAVPYTSTDRGDGTTYLHLEIKGSDVITRLGAKAFAQKLAVTEKRDPRVSGVVGGMISDASRGRDDAKGQEPKIMPTVQMGLKGISDDSFGPDANKQKPVAAVKPASLRPKKYQAPEPQGRQSSLDFK